jgi:outer membrane protein OmpU
MVTRLYLIPICVLFIGLGAPLAQKAGAAEQIKLSLGGKMEQYFFFADVDQLPGESLNSSGALSDVEVYFSGKTVLDNGVEISAKIEMRAENKNSGEVDEQYLDVKTAFGRLNIGEKEGFNQNFSYETPYVAYEDDEIIGRIVPQRTMIGVKEIMTFERFTGDAFQIGYESPTIRGLTVGANYFPTTTQGEDGYFDKSTRDNNAWEVSAAWEGRIKAGKLGLVGGYFDSQSRTLGNDGETAWNVSAQAELGGFTVGGSFIRSTPDDKLNSSTLGLATTYEIGPWGIGASYLRVRAGATDNAAVKDKVDQGKLEASYILVRGVKLGMTGFWVGQEPAGGPEFDDIGLISSAILRF